MVSRNTKYSTTVIDYLEEYGHGTNHQILQFTRLKYPEVTATTIHRVTARLEEAGKIAHAPSDTQGSMRYDINMQPHDHFLCTSCGGIRDLDIADELTPQISQALGGCKISGRLIIHGSCETCQKNN